MTPAHYCLIIPPVSAFPPFLDYQLFEPVLGTGGHEV